MILGEDFDVAIDRAVGQCQLLIALIGLQWLTATDADGNRRLDSPQDWVRLEIKAAFDRDIGVLPLLFDRAKMPAAEELPEDIRQLAKKHAWQMHHSVFHEQVDKLINAIEHLAPKPPGPKQPVPPEPKPPVPIPPEPRGKAMSLREAVDQAGLKYNELSDGALTFPFTSERIQDLAIVAKEMSDEMILFSVPLPKPGALGQEAALRNLLRASYLANYTKVMASDSLDLMAASEIHPSMLTPAVSEGLIRGLAALGDVRSKDLKNSDVLDQLIRQSRTAQELFIEVDADAAKREIRRMAEAEGLTTWEKDHQLVVEFSLLGTDEAPLKVATSASGQVISLGVFTGLKPEGNKVKYMHQLLQLSRVADVARVGFDSDDEVAFLYEVPVVIPGLLEKVKTQFMLLSVGVAAIAA